MGTTGASTCALRVCPPAPFVRDLKKTAPRTSKFAPPSDAKVNSYPERYLSPTAAQKLVHTHIQVSSELFPQWAVEPHMHMCNAFVVAHSVSKRTFKGPRGALANSPREGLSTHAASS